MTNTPDFIIPIELDPVLHTSTSLIKTLTDQYNNYGFRKFAFFTLSKGWRSIGYPPREEYTECAKLFASVREGTAHLGIECGWFLTMTLKSGHSDEFTSPVKADGTAHPFSSCPMDEKFKKRYCEDIAHFCKIARPAFIFTEDDFSLTAVGGCFCEHHLKAFEERVGKYYTRKELVAIFKEETDESYSLMRSWRKLRKDSLVSFAKALRAEIDKETPNIPMGNMQPGGCDYDGDTTEEIARALAAKGQIPFSRIHGTFYCGVNEKRIPEVLYHALYSKQHIGDNFRFYHESDSYPHTRFYTAGKHMKTLMGTVFSYGFDGSLFFTRQFLDEYDEEPVYGRMYTDEHRRFHTVANIAKKCELSGVSVEYDPFFNTVCDSFCTDNPLWVRSLGRLGIPYMSLDSAVTFWDARNARYAEHNTVMDKLSKGLFLDGDAAKALCERGYGRYLGVEIGEDVLKGNDTLAYDLGAKERICDGFVPKGEGRLMVSAHMYAPSGNGKWLNITVTNKKCEVVTEGYTFRDELITPTMTRFENELGGKVVVMSLTLDGNNSQALLNYKRQRLFQRLIAWCSNEYIMVKNEPDIFAVVNKAKDGGRDGILGMVTLTNLCADSLDSIELELPECFSDTRTFRIIDRDGKLSDIAYERKDKGVRLFAKFEFCEPVYIVLENK